MRVRHLTAATAIAAWLGSALGVAAVDHPQSRQSEGRRALTVSVTAYCLEGETKSGEQTRRGIVAADPAVLPLGTVIRLSGLKRYNGTYTVEDTGRAIKGNDVDIFVPDCKAAKDFGRQEGRAQILRAAKGR